MVRPVYASQMPQRLWQIATSLIKVVIWLDLSFLTATSCFYAFIDSFSCDDGLQTGAICTYSFITLSLGLLTFLGLMIWGILQIVLSLRQGF